MSKVQHTLATVDFHGTPLTVITAENGQHLVAMRPVCEAIGLQWHAQWERIQRNNVLSSTVRVIRTVAIDGKEREQVCLPIEYLNGWLFGINTNRVKPEIRQRLENYQRECYQVLHAYWNNQNIQRKRVEQRSELLVAQAYARAANAAEVISKDVFNVVVNGLEPDGKGSWILELEYDHRMNKMVPATKKLFEDNFSFLNKSNLARAMETWLAELLDTESLAKITNTCTAELLKRMRSQDSAKTVQKRVVTKRVAQPGLIPVVGTVGK